VEEEETRSAKESEPIAEQAAEASQATEKAADAAGVAADAAEALGAASEDEELTGVAAEFGETLRVLKSELSEVSESLGIISEEWRAFLSDRGLSKRIEGIVAKDRAKADSE